MSPTPQDTKSLDLAAHVVVAGRCVLRLRPVFEARLFEEVHAHRNVVENAQYALDLVDGVITAVESFARRQRPDQAVIDLVSAAMGSHWVIVAGGLWYPSSCAVMDVARALGAVYFAKGQWTDRTCEGLFEVFVGRELYEMGIRSRVPDVPKDAVEAAMARGMRRIVRDFEGIGAEFTADSWLAISKDIETLTGLAEKGNGVLPLDISATGPLGRLWIAGPPDWLTDLDNQPLLM